MKKFEIIKGIIKNKSEIYDIKTKEGIEDKAIIFQLEDREYKTDYKVIMKDNNTENTFDEIKENEEMYLSVVKDEDDIYEMIKITDKKIYNQLNNLLIDYNLGKIDVLYKNDKINLYTKDSKLPSKEYSIEKDLNIEKNKYQR